MTLAEPAVTLTDYGLVLECVTLALLLHRLQGPTTGFRQWFIVFFSALGFAAFAGGTTHGFIHEKTSVVHTLVWDATLIAIGVVGLAAWMIGAQLVSRDAVRRGIRSAAVTFFVLYCAVVVFMANSFVIAITYYLPATVFLFIMFGLRYQQRHSSYGLSGMSGLVLTIAAAGIQQAQIGLHPILVRSQRTVSSHPGSWPLLTISGRPRIH
jgi:hypothetical protein